MELFREDGCLSDEGLSAIVEGRLDELGRLEAAEHLAYCDRCMDRYTALLTEDILKAPPRSVRRPVMQSIWARVMQNTYGRAAVAGVAAVIALTMWRSDALNALMDHKVSLSLWTPPGDHVEYTEPQSPQEKRENSFYYRLTGALGREQKDRDGAEANCPRRWSPLPFLSDPTVPQSDEPSEPGHSLLDFFRNED
ncbi:MAG: hypothetical protein ACI4LE_08565 [Faecalibacterium sp.]